MINKFEMVPGFTYKNEETLAIAVDKKLKQISEAPVNISYFVSWTPEGRCFPIFVGEKAIALGIHHSFNVVG